MYIASDKFDWELYDAMRFRYYITRYLYKPLVSGHLFLVYKVVQLKYLQVFTIDFLLLELWHPKLKVQRCILYQLQHYKRVRVICDIGAKLSFT